MKRFGQVLWGIFQVLTYLLIQLGIGVLLGIVVSIVKGVQLTTQGIEPIDVMRQIVEYIDTPSFIILLTCAAALISIPIYTVWYNKGYVKGKKTDLHYLLQSKNIAGITILAISTQIFLNMFMGILHGIQPGWFDNYNKLMEQFEIGKSIQSFLYVALFAPVVEELLMRGLVLNQMQKAMPFLAANIVQAFLFALLHGNLIQGSYAFVLGILFGCLYRKYKTIYSTILFHIIFNFSGYVFTIATGNIDFKLVVMIPLMIGCFIISIFMTRKLLSEETATSREINDEKDTYIINDDVKTRVIEQGEEIK